MSYIRLASRGRTVLFLSRPSFDRHFRFTDVTTLAQVYPQADFVFMVYKGQVVLDEIDFYFEFYGAPSVSSGSAVWQRQKPCLCVYQFFTALNATTSLSTFHSNNSLSYLESIPLHHRRWSSLWRRMSFSLTCSFECLINCRRKFPVG